MIISLARSSSRREMRQAQRERDDSILNAIEIAGQGPKVKNGDPIPPQSIMDFKLPVIRPYGRLKRMILYHKSQ